MVPAVLHNPTNTKKLGFDAPFFNQRVGGYNERFTFTGKERDEEGQNLYLTIISFPEIKD